MDNVIAFAHKEILKRITKASTVIDATVGNGHDTVFLAKHAEHVYGFDIQEQAIENTKKYCKKMNLTNVTLFLTSHEHMGEFVKKKVDAVIYNLGYLPNGDKTITTTSDVTMKSIQNILPFLNHKGLIMITIYIGHDEGKKESEILETFFSNLDSSLYTVIRYQLINKKLAPYTVCIQKK